MNQLTAPQGTFTLNRFPLSEASQKKETLRAWDAADEYLLNQLAEEGLPNSGNKLLIVNDTFGALTTALSDFQPTLLSDSYLAHQGSLANLERNQKNAKDVTLLTSLQSPTGTLDLVILKVPKSLSLLEDQLYRLRPHLSANTRIMAAGMVKGIHTSTLNLFEKIIGPTKTSLAKKKARLIFSQFDPALMQGKESPYPKSYSLPAEFSREQKSYTISNHANVFSREKLDIGTRFFLEHIPASSEPKKIIDLGCGNGLVGVIAAERNPAADITFIDESFMAVASAKANMEAAFGALDTDGTDRHQYHVGDCLTGIESNSYDLVLNNPPFHQQNTVGDFIAWQMFVSSKQVLKQGGELWVIGNRHLAYHVKLKRLFGNCKTVASNNKFVILKVVKR